MTAETLFEYRWPREENCHCFMLQEQVCEFLGVKSFKRRYPQLKRRVVDMPERDFLRSEKIVTETQCDLGLTALYSNEVMEIMAVDFPDKYYELCQVLKARLDAKKQKAAQLQAERTPAIKDRSAEAMKRMIKSAADWNKALNKDRKVNRSYSMDLQTFTVHIPESKRLKQILPPHMTEVGAFPVATLPGQYVDPETLKR